MTKIINGSMVQRDREYHKRRDMKSLMNKFLAHPHSVNESYLKHLGFTIKKFFFLLKTAIALLLHGLFPCFFETYTRDNIVKFADTLVKRNPQRTANEA